MSRLGAGIGTRGPGESKLEVDRRRIRDRIVMLAALFNEELGAVIQILRSDRNEDWLDGQLRMFNIPERYWNGIKKLINNIHKDINVMSRFFGTLEHSGNAILGMLGQRLAKAHNEAHIEGISNINKQLAEMERFLNWYGKIKNESGVDNKSYWKRTNSHIYSIKERLLKLDQKIRQISE